MGRVRQLRQLRRGAVPAAVWLWALLAFADAADARKFQMSGTWLVRRGQNFLPFQFGSPATPNIHVSMGSWTSLPSPDPDQVIQGAGGISANAMVAPNPVKIPEHRFVGKHSLLLPLLGTMLVQLTTMFEIDAPHAPATLQAGGGPGNLTWCPSNPACIAGGPIPGMSGNNGRIVYVAGPNRFGGTMQMGLRRGGGAAVKGIGPGVVAHIPYGGSGTAKRRLAVGGGANDAPSIEFRKLAAGVITAPIGGIPASGMLITMPGPVVGMLPSLATPMGGMAGTFQTSWGFGHTTGTVLVQQDFGSSGTQLFTLMGSDLRTLLGAGNLSVVAGGLVKPVTLAGASNYGVFDRVWLSFGPPVPSLSPAGFAAAGGLLLLGTGYALRRRWA